LSKGLRAHRVEYESARANPDPDVEAGVKALFEEIREITGIDFLGGN
jgi:hypothetical protein